MLTAAYTAFQVANSMFSAPYYSIIPELVPLHQRGSAGGWVAFLDASAGLASGGLATLQGNAMISSKQIYVLLVGLNILGLMNGVAAFSAQPGWCEPEAPAPRLAAVNGGGICSFLGAFRHKSFTAMFCFCLFQGLPACVTIYFLQYFLQDVIGQSEHGYDFALLGYYYNGTRSPESATALVNIATSWSQLSTSLAGGYASDRVGIKPVLIFSQLLSAASIATLGVMRDFTGVVFASVCLGAANGIGAGTLQPLRALSLPNNDTAAQDMNIIISAFTIAQILAPIACGAILASLAGGGGPSDGSSDGSAAGAGGSAQAYRAIFFLGAAVQVLALPLLLLVHKRPAKAEAHLVPVVGGNGGGFPKRLHGSVNNIN